MEPYSTSPSSAIAPSPASAAATHCDPSADGWRPYFCAAQTASGNPRVSKESRSPPPNAPQLKRRKLTFALPLLVIDPTVAHAMADKPFIIDPFVFGGIDRHTDIGKTVRRGRRLPPEALVWTDGDWRADVHSGRYEHEKARRAAIAGRTQRDPTGRSRHRVSTIGRNLFTEPSSQANAGYRAAHASERLRGTDYEWIDYECTRPAA